MKFIVVWQKCHSERSEESICPTRDFFRLGWTGEKLRMTPLFEICQGTVNLQDSAYFENPQESFVQIGEDWWESVLPNFT